ncbi:MAG TPA: hypothetical protein VGF57_01160 [Roseiarcus sp.]
MGVVRSANAATGAFKDPKLPRPLAMTFTQAIQALAEDNSSLHAASGRPVA